MPEANRAFIQKELHREPIVLLRARAQPDFKASLASKGEQTLEHVDIELRGFATTLTIDSATGRVVSQTYKGRGPGGVLGETVINYSDFRTVDGLLLPFKVTATFDGQPFPALSATTEAITINAQLDPSTFKKPQPKR